MRSPGLFSSSEINHQPRQNKNNNNHLDEITVIMRNNSFFSRIHNNLPLKRTGIVRIYYYYSLLIIFGEEEGILLLLSRIDIRSLDRGRNLMANGRPYSDLWGFQQCCQQNRRYTVRYSSNER